MKQLLTLLVLVAAFATAAAQDTIPVTGATSGNVNWTADNIYLLQGYYRVDNGDTLTIQAGTVVLADTGSQENASALIIERDGYIDAQGSATEPIIFTSVINNTTDPNDILNNQAKGLWGGIIMCGDASTNTNVNGSEQVEGIPSTLPATVGTYGGSEDDDDSGILRYVSIRHTGVALASNNEIQGLTLAGVGSGTTIEYVESYASDDDGIEIFGGTVNMKYVCIAFAADDMLDLDQGYRGKMENVFIIQSLDFGDRMGEWDGADTPEDGTPTSAWKISNMTMMGRRDSADDRVITYRANGRGQVWNSIMINQTNGIDIQLKSDADVPVDSYDGIAGGQTAFAGNIFWNVADNTGDNIFTISRIASPTWTNDSVQIEADAETAFDALFDAGGNVAVDPQIAGGSYISSEAEDLDPRFSAFEVTNNVADPTLGGTDNFFSGHQYKGAFPQSAAGFWIKGWTALDFYGYLPENPADVTNVEANVIKNIAIYPNPSTGLVNIEATDLNQSVVKISVFDLAGRQVFNSFSNPVAGALNTTVDLSGVQAGVYVIKVQNGINASVERIVIE